MTDDAPNLIDNYNDDIEMCAKSKSPCLLSNLGDLGKTKMPKIKSTLSLIGTLD